MQNKKGNCLDTLLIVAMASFVCISLPITSIIIHDYHNTLSYVEGTCNGLTLSNLSTVSTNGVFYRGSVNVISTVNNTKYSSSLYYPPLKHWQLCVETKESINYWYDSLNKTGEFTCYININHGGNLAIVYWLDIMGYYVIFTLSLLIITATSIVVCFNYTDKRREHGYQRLNMEQPYFEDPGTPLKNTKISQYKSLNDELILMNDE